MNNAIFHLLCVNETTPRGWGFPPISDPTLYSKASKLRATLMFLTDEEGKYQLWRWYHALIRSAPAVWASLAGDEGYSPHLFPRQSIESPTLEIDRSINSGALLLGWRPDITVTSLTGVIEEGVMSLGSKSYPVQIQEGALERCDLILPLEFEAELSVSSVVLSGRHLIYFRPASFHALSIAERVLTECFEELNSASLLDAFLALPRAEDKLAFAWLAVHRLEKQV